MKVKRLIEILSNIDPETEVVLQSDSEGNNYSPLEDYWEADYVPTTTWYGEAHIKKLTPELIKKGFTEEDLCDDENKVSAIILVPVN